MRDDFVNVTMRQMLQQAASELKKKHPDGLTRSEKKKIQEQITKLFKECFGDIASMGLLTEDMKQYTMKLMYYIENYKEKKEDDSKSAG